MTEQEWLDCTDAQVMLEILRDKASDRKLLLFATACCRRVIRLTSDPRSGWAVDVAEQQADGLVTSTDWDTAFRLVLEAANDDQEADLALQAVFLTSVNGRISDCQWVIRHSLTAITYEAWRSVSDPLRPHRDFDKAKSRKAKRTKELADLAVDAESIAQAVILRDLIGNPFRVVTLEPAWLALTVVGLAQTIYNDRVFDCLPILSDALEEAGCTNAEILEHCRSEGPHVRGCWVVDLLLGKE